MHGATLYRKLLLTLYADDIKLCTALLACALIFLTISQWPWRLFGCSLFWQVFAIKVAFPHWIRALCLNPLPGSCGKSVSIVAFAVVFADQVKILCIALIRRLTIDMFVKRVPQLRFAFDSTSQKLLWYTASIYWRINDFRKRAFCYSTVRQLTR